METTIRNATLGDLSSLLQTQQARQLDVVANATNMRSEDGQLVLYGTEAELMDDGVMPTEGKYRVTDVFDDGVSSKLDIPRAYLRRMRTDRPDILDATFNGWLRGDPTLNANNRADRAGEPVWRDPRYAADQRQFLLRLWRGDNGPGIARALLSDRYGIIDNLDILMATLDGVRAAGVKVEIPTGGADLTERRMHVRFTAPQIRAYAPDLLAGYRSPFDGRDVGGRWTPESVARASQAERAEMNDVVFAGFALRNSEVGAGAWKLTPYLIIQVCGNGLCIAADSLRGAHLGGKLDDGIVRWTKDTERKSLDLVKAKTRDTVATYLDVEYVRSKVAELQETAEVKITDAPKVVERVSKELLYTDAEQASLLDHFIQGGQITAGGIMQAVTSVAQIVDNADEATRLEESAIKAMAIAAASTK